MNESEIQKINVRIDRYADEVALLLQNLIKIKSYSGREEDIVTHILKVMESFGFDDVYSDNLGNAVGRIGDGSLILLYDAHIDTVEVTGTENWKYPPFGGEIHEGKIYGRGAVDEKAAMAGYLIAARILKELKMEIPFTLYIVGSVLEEDCDGYPLYHLIKNEGIKPDFVLLGEPTDLVVYRGQRGRMEMELTTRGKSAHGAHNHKGVNAIYKMNTIINRIAQLDQELPLQGELGKGSITVSDITSKAPSLCSVPDSCRIHLDRRLTAGETRESALNEIRKIAAKDQIEIEIEIPEYQGISWKGLKFTQEAYFPTWIMDEAHPLVQAGLKTAGKIGCKSEKAGPGDSPPTV